MEDAQIYGKTSKVLIVPWVILSVRNICDALEISSLPVNGGLK